MRGFYILFFVVFFAFLDTPVFGQSLGLTGAIADTVVANRLLNEANILNKQIRYVEAYFKADSARIIFTKVLGGEVTEVADVLYKMGVFKYYQGNYDTAIEIWEKSKEIRIKILGDEHPHIASLYNNIGVAYDAKGEYTKAIEYYLKSLEIRLKALGEEHPAVALSYSNLGNSYKAKGEYDKAIEYHRKALEIRLKTLGPEHNDVAASYDGLGNFYQAKGEYDKAIEYKEKALDIRLKTLGPEHPDLAVSYNNLGNSYDSKGEYDKAIEYHRKALEIRLKALGPEHTDVAASYDNLGVSYENKGEYVKAIEYKEKALDIRLKTLGPEHPELAASYNNIGVSYNSKGEYSKAIENHQKSLLIKLKILGSEHPDIATSYNNLGFSYYSKGGNDKAIEYFQKALDIQLTALGLEHPDVAMSYNNLGALYNSIGNYGKSIEFHQNALKIKLKSLGSEHPDVADSYNNIGATYISLGQYIKAIEYFQKSLKIKLKVLGAACPDVGMSYNNIGNSYYFNREFDKASEFYQKVIAGSGSIDERFSKVNSTEQLLYGLIGLGKVLKAQYTISFHLQILNLNYSTSIQALSALEYQQTNFSEESSKSFWLSKNYPIYEQAISVSLLKAEVDHNDILRQNTFQYAEKSKASLLQAQIKATDAINFSGIPDSLLEKEHNLRIDISWREKQRQSLLDKGLSETDTNTLRISSIIFDLKQQYETLKKRFETEYPEYYRLKYDLSTVSLQYVQDTLLQPKNQALLEYFVGDSSIYLFLVRPDTLIIQEVKRDFPLEAWIEGLRYGIYGHYAADKAIQTDSLKADAKRAYLEFAPKLYQKLVAPIAQHLPKKVILVPDGPLGYVPFDALLTAAPEDANNFKSYPYLIQKHQFSYTYSATLLREMRDKKHRQEPKKDFVAFAPFYNGDTTLLANMYAYDDLMRKDLQPLAFSGPEVAAASKLMQGETVAGTAATEEKFTSMASDYRIIHLATHGRADNRVGDYAFLAFTEIKDSLENELLYVKDLYNLQLNADLVVLSACETGIGKLQRGEGIISLARAFAYAGAKSIVTSLWSVNDKSTSELMRLFYRELQQGKDKDEALRLARLRFLKESSVRNAHPFFWAAFVPLGDMRAVR